MKKEDFNYKVTLTFDDGFADSLLLSAEKSFAVAEKKWGVSLNTDDHDKVIENAFKQLENQVSEHTKHDDWSIYDDRLVVHVAGYRSGRVKVPTVSNRNSVMVLKRRAGWVYDDDNNEDAININDLTDFYKEQIVKMLDTAVFYGVGSYAQL